MFTCSHQPMKILKVHEDTHRELKIEAAQDGRSMEGLSSDLIDAALELKRKKKLRLVPRADEEPAKKPAR